MKRRILQVLQVVGLLCLLMAVVSFLTFHLSSGQSPATLANKLGMAGASLFLGGWLACKGLRMAITGNLRIYIMPLSLFLGPADAKDDLGIRVMGGVLTPIGLTMCVLGAGLGLDTLVNHFAPDLTPAVHETDGHRPTRKPRR